MPPPLPPSSAAPSSPIARVAAWARRRPRLAAGLAGAFVLYLVVGSWADARRDERRAAEAARSDSVARAEQAVKDSAYWAENALRDAASARRDSLAAAAPSGVPAIMAEACTRAAALGYGMLSLPAGGDCQTREHAVGAVSDAGLTNDVTVRVAPGEGGRVGAVHVVGSVYAPAYAGGVVREMKRAAEAMGARPSALAAVERARSAQGSGYELRREGHAQGGGYSLRLKIFP